jgi:hypothetical protein
MKTAAREQAARADWRALIDRLDGLAYPIVTIVAVAIVAGGQLAEDFADSPPLQMMPPDVLIQRWSVVALVLYALVMWAVIDRTVMRSLPVIRQVVKIDQDSFDEYIQRVRRPSATVELGILIGVVLINLVLFVGLNSDLLLDDPVTERATKLPENPGAATIIIAGYVVIGWAFLRLIYFGGRLARQLGRLSREPLQINVFDTTDLLPFGNIALALALAPAGVLVILLAGLGAPTNPVGWSVVAEATLVIVLVLLLPLRGIHRQMSAAKDAALGVLNLRIGEVYQAASGDFPTESTEVARVAAATGTLIPLRKTVQEMTTWPFRDTVALGRAVLIASAPLIYTTLSELIRIYLIPALSP